MALVFDATYNNADVMRKVRETQKAFAELGNTAEIQGRRIDAAFEKISLKSLERMMEIMKNFPKEIQGLSSFQKQIDGLEKHIERVNQRIASVGGGKLGSTFSDASSNINIGDVLKEQVYVGAQAVNDLSEKIIQQKILIKDIEGDIRALGEAYKRAGEGTTRGNALFADFASAKKALQEEKNALFELQTQQAQARLSVRKLRDEQSLYQKEAQDVASANEKMSLSFQKTLAAIGGVAALKQLGSAIIEARAEMQQLEKSFEVLLGSKAKSDVFVKEIKDYALISPLNVNDVSKAAQTLLGFGVSTEKVIPSLKMLGDVSMGNSQRFSSLALAFAQVQAAGKLTGNDLLQLVNAGFNPLKIISEQTGKSMSDLKKEMSDGSISADMVANAFKSATEQGGQFHGMIEKNADGIRNAQNVLQGAIQETLNKIGEQNEWLIKGGYEAATYLVENYSEIGNCITGLVGIYGTYRTALLINSVLELGSVKAVWAKVTATKAATIAQAAYNKVLMLNPYVAIGAVVLSLCIAMWTLADHTTTAEKAQKRFNDALAAQKQQLDNLKSSAINLINTIKSETNTQYEKMEAYLKLQKIFPEVFKNMDIEKIKLMDLVTYEKLLAEARTRREIVGAKTNLVLKTNAYNDAKERYSKTSSKNSNILVYYAQMKAAEEDMKLAQKHVDDILKIQAEARESIKPVRVKLLEAQNSRDQIVQEYAAARLTLEEEQRKIQESGFGVIPIDVQVRFDNAQAQLNNIDKTIASLMQGNTTQTYKEAYSTAEREWKTAQKVLVESKKKSKAEYIAAKKDLDEKEKNFKDLGGVTNTTKQESAAEKLRKQQESLRKEQEKYSLLMDKQTLDRKRQQQDLENQAAQAEIDALDDSFEKKDRQRKLNNKKEIQALERQKEDYIRAYIQAEKEKFDAEEELKAKQKKGYIRKIFDPSTVKVDASAFDGIIGNTSKKQLNDKVREHEDSWNEYLIKFGNYQQKRAAIIEKYDNLIKNAEDAGKAATYEKDKQNAVDELDNSIKNSTTLMGQLFADASQKSANEIQSVIEKAELLMQYLGAVKDEQGNAQIGGKTVSKNDILGLGVSNNTLQNLETSTEQVESLRNAIDRLKGDLGSKSPFKLFETQLDAATKKIAQGGNKNIAQGITEIGEAITSFSPAVSQFGKDLGNIFGSDGLGNKIAGISEAVGGLGQTAMGVGQIMSGDIVGGAMSAVNGISSVVSALDGLFGADYSKYNEMKEQYETINSIWDELIDKKTEYLEIGTTEERKRTEEEILDLIGRQEQASRNMGKERLNSGASAGSHSIGVRIRKGMSDEGWSQWNNFADANRINRDLGGRMEGLFNLTSKQLDELRLKAPDFWAKLDSDVKKYLEDIIACGEQAEEAIERSKELWTGISFDSLVDNFKRALYNMDSSAKDLADDFQQYLMNAMIDSFVNGEEFQKKLRDWYDKFAEYSKSNNELTTDEKNELKKDWEIMVQGGIDYRNDLFESMGFNGTSESTSQNSTQKGFESMSQDTGNELNGRFTALQISNEEIKNSMLSMLTGVNLISTTTVANGITLMEIRNLAISSNSHLEDIARFTKPLLDVGGKLDRIESNTKGLVSR